MKSDMPSRLTQRTGLFLLVAVMGLASGSAGFRMVEAEPGSRLTAAATVDVALGKHERTRFEQLLARKAVAGRVYPWSQYVRWGKELVETARVSDPPEGSAPSQPLSERYRCLHCHNVQREDVRLTVQDPETRERLIRQLAPADPARLDAATVRLTTGTTLWGAVNRESFYNGHYARYRNQTLADGRPMNPYRLADAIQVCCRFCSGGRYPTEWELDALLAYHWELELRLRDLDFPAADLEAVLAGLNSGHASEVVAARMQVRRKLLTVSAATKGAVPLRSEGDTDFYADGSRISGDARRGKLVYESACACCHGNVINSLSGKALLMDDRRFHHFVREGTERDGLYMPLFTLERLSRPQVADVRAYLRSLPR